MVIVLALLFLLQLTSQVALPPDTCIGDKMRAIDQIDTEYPTNDLASFEFEGEYYLVTPHHDTVDPLESAIWRYDSLVDGYEIHQLIPTYGCHDVEWWLLDGDVYLFFGNMLNNGTYYQQSPVYRMQSGQSSFVKIQDIDTVGTTDSEHFFISTDLYLLVSHLFNGTHMTLPSQIYKWNTDRFEPFQTIGTIAPFACHEFQIGSDYFVGFANAGNLTVDLYKWSGSQFLPFTTFVVSGEPRAMTHFSLDQTDYLYIGTEEEVPAQLYGYDGATGQFVLEQDLPSTSYKNREGTFFVSFTGNQYLFVANLGTATTYDVNSVLLRWDGQMFSEYQFVTAHGAEEFALLEGPWVVTRLILSEYGTFEGDDRNSTLYEFDLCFVPSAGARAIALLGMILAVLLMLF